LAYISAAEIIAERARCRVGPFWAKVEDYILQTI